MPGHQEYCTLESFLVRCTYFHSSPYNSEHTTKQIYKMLQKLTSTDNLNVA